MLKGRTKLIRITLHDGDPDGMRTVNIANSTTVLISCPLTQIGRLREREEADRPAVYFLSGDDEGSDVIYIGECDSFGDRFRGRHHALAKAEWQQVTLATTSDETFNKAHARRAEHMLVERARELKRSRVFTDQTSPGKLSEGDAALASDFVADVALMAEIIGVRVFRGRELIQAPSAAPNVGPVSTSFVPLEMAPASVATNLPFSADTDDVFRFTGVRDVEGLMKIDGTRFILLAGSEVRQSNSPSCPSAVLPVRERLISAGLAEPIGTRPGYLRLKVDVPAGSTSAAAGILAGTSLRGPHVWEHIRSGLRYDRWIENQQISGDGT